MNKLTQKRLESCAVDTSIKRSRIVFEDAQVERLINC